MKNIYIILSFVLLSFSSLANSNTQKTHNTILATIPNKPYFIEQCSFPTKISLKYNNNPFKIIYVDLNNPIWGKYKTHPLSISLVSVSAKIQSNIFTKYNSPDYCSYATSIDIIIEIQPTIVQTSQLNNNFFTCINDNLKKREIEYTKYHISQFLRDKLILDAYLKKLGKDIFPIYSTTDQSSYYNEFVGNKVHNILNQFNLAKENEFIKINEYLNNQRDYSKINNCLDEADYFQQFLDTIK